MPVFGAGRGWKRWNLDSQTWSSPVFQKVPRIAWCSKLRTLFLGSQFGPFFCAFSMFCHSIRLCVEASKKARCQAPHSVEPSEDAFSRLGAQMGTVFGACVADFSTWREELEIFRAWFWVRFFMPVLGQVLTCARAPIFGPKMRTPSRSRKHNSNCNYICPLLWRPSR